MPFQDPQHTVEHIYGGSSAYESKRQLKAAEREVNSIDSPLVNKLPKWSEVTISFEKGDCPIPSTRPGRYPIVVEPTINNCRVNRVLVDGGSSLNILFTNALDEMQVPRTKVRPVRYSFHGIVPGSSAKPIGQVSLPLTFGSPSNFRTEKISFDVVDFDTAYNAILGRPALAKFLMATHYGYQCLKMPGPKGVITIHCDKKMALTCDRRSLEMVGQIPTREESQPSTSKSKPKAAPKPNDQVKEVPLDAEEPSKTVRIGDTSDPQ